MANAKNAMSMRSIPVITGFVLVIFMLNCFAVRGEIQILYKDAIYFLFILFTIGVTIFLNSSLCFF